MLKKILAAFLLACSTVGMLLLTTDIKSYAAVIPAKTDVDGSVTGVVNAKYYDVSSWRDMYDTYQASKAGQTIYLNVVKDIPGDAQALKGVPVGETKNLTIIGNGHQLYFAGSPNDRVGTSRFSAEGSGAGFYANNDASLTGKTTLVVQDAKIINGISNGIFSIRGASAPNVVYKNVTVTNGGARTGASPIRNDQGKVLLEGNNEFNINADFDFNTPSTIWRGDDNNGEWIQGGHWVEVVNGKTTLNQNWAWDQPFYTNNNGDSATLKIDDNASLNWNLNDTYTMYYGSSSGPLNWDIGNNANFTVNGTSATASHSNDWFMWTSFTDFNFHVHDNANLQVKMAGGPINLDEFRGLVNWQFDPGSKVDLQNLGKGNVIQGNVRAGSSMNFNNINNFTIQSLNQAGIKSNIPLNFNGNSGVKLHASSNFDGSDSAVGSFLYKRPSTGTIDGNFTTSTMGPIKYEKSDLTFLQKAKYIDWRSPDGLAISNSKMDRSYNVDLADLPRDGSYGSTIVGNDTMDLNVQDDRLDKPNFTIQANVLNNQLSSTTKYYWQSLTLSDKLSALNNEPQTIETINSNSTLPDGVSTTQGGMNFTFNYPNNKGLLLKATNDLQQGNGQGGATIQYNIVNGPQ